MTGPAGSELTDRLAALINGHDVRWSALRITAPELFAICDREGLTGLVARAVTLRSANDWPPAVRDQLRRWARAEAARELARQHEIASVLDTLARSDVHPILLKGAPLAYSVYGAPVERPREDTDLLVRRDQIDAVREAMRGVGYAATPYCDGELLFCQFELQKRDAFGLEHAFDVHWKISTQSAFADVLTNDELDAGACTVPKLGPHARAPGAAHALLLACIHPVMHHRNRAPLIWTYDIHLLASCMSGGELERVGDLALARGVASITRHQLQLAHRRFGTRIPDALLARLAAIGRGEKTAVYLERDRRWHDELISSVRGLRRWRDRVRLLREVAFPSPHYMLTVYRVRRPLPGAALLPALYLDRVMRGTWKVLAGRK